MPQNGTPLKGVTLLTSFSNSAHSPYCLPFLSPLFQENQERTSKQRLICADVLQAANDGKSQISQSKCGSL